MGKHLKKGAGGYRANAGRKKGSGKKAPDQKIATRRNMKIANDVLEELRDAKQSAELPLERMLRRMNDPKVDDETKDTLAGMAAPYVHAKLSNVQHSLQPGQAAVGPDGKPAKQEAARPAKVTVTMNFDNEGTIKEN